MLVSGSSYTWFIFNLNTKQGYPQITYEDIHSHRYMYTHDDFLSIHPLLPDLTSICPFLCNTTPLFTYLEILLLLFVVQLPIHFCPWFAINCSPLAASPTPRYPTDQVTYLHRQHQQHQPSRLTHGLCTFTRPCFSRTILASSRPLVDYYPFLCYSQFSPFPNDSII